MNSLTKLERLAVLLEDDPGARSRFDYILKHAKARQRLERARTTTTTTSWPGNMNLNEGFEQHSIPERMRSGLADYIERGVKPGSFLRAVLCGDLFAANACADATNKHLAMNYVWFLEEYAPRDCYGSPDAVFHWIERHGIGRSKIDDYLDDFTSMLKRKGGELPQDREARWVHENNRPTLVDLVAMVCSLKAESLTSDDPEYIEKRIRFGEPLDSILINTVEQWSKL